MKRLGIYTVGDMRRAIEGLPDDRQLVSQVVAKDKTAWIVYCAFDDVVPESDPPMASLTLSHPQLETLQNAGPAAARIKGERR